VTESSSAETNPKFVKVIWEGDLEIPPLPQGQEVEVTYSYDDNQCMRCSFKHSKSGREASVDLEMGKGRDEAGEAFIDRFTVE